jgi:hypothetical protein
LILLIVFVVDINFANIKINILQGFGRADDPQSSGFYLFKDEQELVDLTTKAGFAGMYIDINMHIHVFININVHLYIQMVYIYTYLMLNI